MTSPEIAIWYKIYTSSRFSIKPLCGEGQKTLYVIFSTSKYPILVRPDNVNKKVLNHVRIAPRMTDVVPTCGELSAT